MVCRSVLLKMDIELFAHMLNKFDDDSVNHITSVAINRFISFTGSTMKKLFIITAAMAMACSASSVFAAASEASSMTVNGGTIKFIGSVTDAPCAISMALKDHVVVMKQVRTAHLTTAGQPSGQPTAFNIDLEDCDSTTYKNATMTFNGTPDPTINTALANQATSDAATHVALQLYGPDGQVLNLGEASSAVTLVDGTNKVPFKVDYISTDSAATAGSVDATATVQITYS